MSAVEALAEVIRDEIQKYPKLDAPIHGQIGWGATEHTIATALVAAIRSMPAEQVAELIGGETESQVRPGVERMEGEPWHTDHASRRLVRVVTPWSPLGVSPETNAEEAK